MVSPLDGPIVPVPYESYLEPAPVLPPVPSFPTSLTLTPELEKRFIAHAVQRFDDLCEEMGRLDDGSVEGNSWMWIREKNELTYGNDLSWRQAMGGIFEKSNFTVGTNQRYARLLSARVRDDLLGTRPFFGCMTSPGGDPEITRQAETYVQDQIHKSNVPDALREALRTALIRNESVLKTVYFVDESQYKGPATVAVGPTGQPIITPSGLYIKQDDDFIPDPTTEGLTRLKKDPLFVWPQGRPFQWQHFPVIPQTLTHYRNVHSTVIDYRDFLCPLDADDVCTADINIHLYELSPERLKKLFAGIPESAEYFSWRMNVSGAKKAKEQHGENERTNRTARNSRNVLIAECYLRFDADGDGMEEEVILVLDLGNERAVFYDYLGNHMKARPFSVIVGIEKVPNRWYGVGVFSKMEHAALYIDAQFNRINEKDSQESSITFRDRNAVQQWSAGEPAELGSRRIYDINPGFDAKNRPPIFRVNLQSEADLGTELMSLMQQSSDLQFAVVSSRDASASGLNQSKTATGVMSIERDANVVTKDTEQDHVKGIEATLDRAVELVLDRMDRTVMQFDRNTAALVTLNRDEIRGIERNTKLLLTRTRSAEMLATNEKAEAIALRYHNLPPRIKFHMRVLYVNELKGLEIDDVDQVLGPALTMEEVQMAEQAAAEAAKSANATEPPKPPALSIPYELETTPPSILAQIEQARGFTPATPEERDEMIARKLLEKKMELESKEKQSKNKPTNEPNRNPE